MPFILKPKPIPIMADSHSGVLRTLSFPKSVVTNEVIITMVDNFKGVYENLSNEKNIRLSDHQVVILASMIEKETGAPSEREDISAVFHNRLKKGMRLECDPTVIYGMGDSYKGNIRKKNWSVCKKALGSNYFADRRRTK